MPRPPPPSDAIHGVLFTPQNSGPFWGGGVLDFGVTSPNGARRQNEQQRDPENLSDEVSGILGRRNDGAMEVRLGVSCSTV